MVKAVFRGIQGLFLGYMVYLLFCFAFRIRADNGTGGCVAILAAIIFFAVSLAKGKPSATAKEAAKSPDQVETTPGPVCPNCGNVGLPGDLFCQKCGKPLNRKSEKN